MKTLCFFGLSLIFVFRIFALPPADELLESIHTVPKETETASLVGDLEKRMDDLEDPGDRLNAWLDTYIIVTAPANRNSSFEERKELELQIPKLGKFFPPKDQWDFLKEQIHLRQSDEPNPSLVKLSYLIAILESDTEAATRILRSNFPEATAEQTAGENSIQQALSRNVYGSHRKMSLKRSLLEVAFNENGLPDLQRVAYEIWASLSEETRNQMYVNVPDLTRLYSEDEVTDKIEEFVQLAGEDFRIYSLSKNMVEPVLSAYRNLDMTPPEDIINKIQPDSENYQENIEFLSEKFGKEKFQEILLTAQIKASLKQGDAEMAWENWQALAQVDTDSASQLVRGLYGWRGRNYPRKTILAFSYKLLPYSENADFLRQLNELIPMDGNPNDRVLLKIDALLEKESDSVESLNLETLKLERLLAYGAYGEAGSVAKKILQQKDTITKTLKGNNYWFDPLRFARAFRLLENPEISEAWVDVGIESTILLEGYSARHAYTELIDLALESGKDSQAFQYASDSFKQASIKESDYDQIQAARPLSYLVLLYTKAGQPEDALTLLNEAVGWSVTDLALLHNPLPEDSIHTVVARALVQTDQLDTAKLVLKDHLLYSDNSDDSAYNELVQIEGQGALPFLKELQREYPFEERPLIWQAVLAQNAGHLEVAENMAREAIAIDPTDGEMNAKNRLRAYAVLGSILEQREDPEADLYNQVVASVDLAEKADEYRVAGLTSKALILYEDAMNLFTDAYCVQFRAAVEYEAVGQIDKAEEHFEIAYRLMPNQFGRIESHCFGCEGAFNGERATGIAERVFKSMLQKNPEQASLYYLMGYLYNSKGFPEEALGYFKRAVELDPLYYNSWKHISSITKSGPEFDEVLYIESLKAMLKIAPLRTIGKLDSLSISMVGAMWNEIPGYYPLLPKRTRPVYPLTASAEVLEESGRNRDDWREDLWQHRSAGQVLFSNYRIPSFLLNH